MKAIGANIVLVLAVVYIDMLPAAAVKLLKS
jgi:hypothetical protein